MLNRYPSILNNLRATEEDFSDPVPMFIQDMARWFFKDYDIGEDFRDLFPSCVPPWSLMWMEYEMQDGMTITAHGDHILAMQGQHGFLIGTSVVGEENAERAVKEDWGFRMVAPHVGPGARRKAVTPRRQAFLRDTDLKAGWLVSVVVYSKMTSSSVVLPMCMSAHYLDRTGRPFPDIATVVSDTYATLGQAGSRESEVIAAMHNLVLPCFFTLSLLNSKNVETEDVEHPRLLTALKSRKKRKQIEEDMTYKNVVIYLPGKKRKKYERNDSSSEDSPRQKAHLVRGHWRDCREVGLFGKDELRGLYYIPQHIKGAKHEGMIHKTYTAKRNPHGT